MPMSFSLTQMILISAAYLTFLFGVAWMRERVSPKTLLRNLHSQVEQIPHLAGMTRCSTTTPLPGASVPTAPTASSGL